MRNRFLMKPARRISWSAQVTSSSMSRRRECSLSFYPQLAGSSTSRAIFPSAQSDMCRVGALCSVRIIKCSIFSRTQFIYCCVFLNRRLKETPSWLVRLRDGRLLAIECKGSNREINSRKRLNKEAAQNARAWLVRF